MESEINNYISWCRDNHVYFINTYCRIMTDDGLQPIILRAHQEAYLKDLEENHIIEDFTQDRIVSKKTTN